MFSKFVLCDVFLKILVLVAQVMNSLFVAIITTTNILWGGPIKIFLQHLFWAKIAKYHYFSKLLVFYHYLRNIQCRCKGPRSYIGPWALSEEINRSEEKLLIMRYSQTKFYKWRANEWLSKEYILLRLNKFDSFDSKHIIQQLK